MDINYREEADYIVIGSGAGGATAGMVLAENHQDTLILEEGGWYRQPDFQVDVYSALSTLFRDFGAQVASGGGGFYPVLQGCCVGGSTVMNGAIVHRLPEKIYRDWSRDPAIAQGLPYEKIQKYSDVIEKDLGIRANLEPALSDLPVHAALEKLGWKHQAMVRNAPGCQATGRCLQGCPSGGKLSMEASYIPRAVKAGARVFERHRAEKILMEGQKAAGVLVKDSEGKETAIRARKGVILSAGTVHSPALLWKSGLGNASAHIGKHFQCHLGANILGLLRRDVREVEGPPQGIEVLQFQEEGIKLATQLLPPEMLVPRTSASGRKLVALLQQWKKISDWTASVKTESEGEVSLSWRGKPSIRFRPGESDMKRLRKALHLLAQLLFDLGADVVYPGVAGVPFELESRADAERILSAPLDPRAYFIGIGHIFGTCRMAGSAKEGVIGPDFQVHGARGLSIVDGSVFPSAIGVNPQHTIMTLAMCAAHGLLDPARN